jgi:hypothetical protein
MATFRVEIEDRCTITREEWFEAATEEDARVLAEAEDWRTFSEVGRSTNCEIVLIEECEE